MARQTHVGRVGWDVLVTCCLCYLMMTVPFELAFNANLADYYLTFAAFDNIVQSIFILDIIVNFRTGSARSPEVGLLSIND